MKKRIHVLIVEDSEDDALLLVSELRKGGFDPVHQRVEDVESMRTALATGAWQVVLSDYKLPRMDGKDALCVLKESGCDLPFIIVSGTIGEDVAVAVMREGAHDYLMKGKLGRLAPAIERELRDFEIRYERRKVEEDRQELREKLRQAQKMEAIGTLAGGIAHDFNNILASAFGFTEIALMDQEKGSRASKCLEQVMIAHQRAADLVKQILAFSRQSESERKPMQMQPVVMETIKLLRGSLPSTVEIRSHIMQECGPVMADPVQIHQITMNLCMNAFHAMRERGSLLSIRLEPVELSGRPAASEPLSLAAGHYIVLCVKDDGSGMDEETLSHIFEPYFTTKTGGEGTGLGLATVHGIVQQYEGAITVKSRPGQGTEFRVYFPLCAMREAVGVQARLPETAKGRERILFVDDEQPITQFVKASLESLGFTVYTRTSSIEAHEAFRANPGRFDVVVTDLAMPNMNGAELAQKIRRIRPDMPVILCTGFSEMLTLKRAREVGIFEYIKKPILIRELAGVIRRALQDSGSQAEAGM
ncbi:MAG: response regulator [Planctomycetota bacterium]